MENFRNVGLCTFSLPLGCHTVPPSPSGALISARDHSTEHALLLCPTPSNPAGTVVPYRSATGSSTVGQGHYQHTLASSTSLYKLQNSPSLQPTESAIPLKPPFPLTSRRVDQSAFVLPTVRIRIASSSRTQRQRAKTRPILSPSGTSSLSAQQLVSLLSQDISVRVSTQF